MSKKSKKVVFINGTLLRNVHQKIDAGIIAELSYIFNDITVYLTRPRLDYIKQDVDRLVKENSINWKYLSDNKKRGAFNDILATCRELIVLLRNNNKDTLFVVSFLNMFNCHILNLFSKILKQDIIFIAHSELQVIQWQRSSIKNYWIWLTQKFYFETKWSEHLKVIVLGDNIRNNAFKILDKKKKSQLFSIDHPYYKVDLQIDNTIEIKEKKQKNLIKIGIIGYVNKEKERGLDNIISLAKKLSCFSNIKFYIISKIDKNLRDTLPRNIIVLNTTDDFLSKEEYESFINIMDFILLPYPKNSFAYTASGAILESFFFSKPIIMYKNCYSTYLSSKYGKIGYFVDNINVHTIYELLNDNIGYTNLKKQMLNIQQQIKPAILYKQLYKVINDTNL